MDNKLLKKRVEERLVSVQKHSKADLFIYNYTAKVQYDKLWDEITLQTRGLILDAEMNIVAKPFGKFFNIEEHPESDIPMLPFDVFEKLDGSLGILYWVDGKPFIATRGSFESDQALHATQILYSKYGHLFNVISEDKTYLFEIIYPENRIVVNYGELDDLFLLTIIDNKTGCESIENIGFPMVKRYDGINSISELKSLEETNKEGFVVKFKNGFRVKMKFAEYVRLHRIITGVSNIAIWEYLRDEKPFDELLEKVPDEFYDWLTNTKNDIVAKYNEIYTKSYHAFHDLYMFHNDKKKFAIKVLSDYKEISSILFNIYNNKSIEPIIWKMIRPKYSKPFKKDE